MWDSIGFAYHNQGNYAEAVASYKHALEIFDELGERYGHAETLGHLGDTYFAMGSSGPRPGRVAARLASLEELGHPDAENLRAKITRAGGPAVSDRLDEYRRKRDAGRTPEPVPADVTAAGRGDAFVIQQHHARSLHWDLRLERDGVLVSWAVPRGIPRDPARNHLAVQTEDHPMEYLTFHGEIPAGEYGGGTMTIHDTRHLHRGEVARREVIVVLRGERVSGRYVLFRTDGKNWMIHRMDPPPAGWTPMPERIEPMRPAPARRLPADDGAWAYELAWDGVRAVAYVSGGRLRLMADGDEDVTGTYPELRAMAERLAPTECVLDGEIVAFDRAGRITADALRTRRTPAAVPGVRPAVAGRRPHRRPALPRPARAARRPRAGRPELADAAVLPGRRRRRRPRDRRRAGPARRGGQAAGLAVRAGRRARRPGAAGS